ncbi:hypothetical protein FOZ61_002592 [Perkinsus olseni]|uniref:Uncharacterized protein n=1 Tax=Perkinsus olseni TaxID=32597 RepID=A0A7J6KNV3_PEROL|nr:hypothetical protein FOZ61_002592 [Perkinsus olseni]
MAHPLIVASVFSLALLVYGNRPEGVSKPGSPVQPGRHVAPGTTRPPEPTTLSLGPVDSNASFLYQSDVATLGFVLSPDGRGMFSVECESEYSTPWFALTNHGTATRPLYTWSSYQDYLFHLPRLDAACPQLDFSFTPCLFYVFYDEMGNLKARLRDIVTLEREWLPLAPGEFSGSKSSQLQVKMQYNVNEDGSVAVKLGCATGDTGFKRYSLLRQRFGERYKVIPMKGGETLQDLVKSLEKVCPDLSPVDLEVANYLTVGFAAPDVMHVRGRFTTDSLYKS